jgi:hypothetical protein
MDRGATIIISPTSERQTTRNTAEVVVDDAADAVMARMRTTKRQATDGVEVKYKRRA